MAKKTSRLCLSVKERDRVRIGSDIEIVPYKHGTMIRLIITSPRTTKIERIQKRNAKS